MSGKNTVKGKFIVKIKLFRRETSRKFIARKEVYDTYKNKVVSKAAYVVKDPDYWKSKREGKDGWYGKLYFRLLSQTKKEIEKQTKCEYCGRGEVYFLRIQKGHYSATWDKLHFTDDGRLYGDEHICRECWEKLHPAYPVYYTYMDDEDGEDNTPRDRQTGQPLGGLPMTIHRARNIEEYLESDYYQNYAVPREERKMISSQVG